MRPYLPLPPHVIEAGLTEGIIIHDEHGTAIWQGFEIVEMPRLDTSISFDEPPVGPLLVEYPVHLHSAPRNRSERRREARQMRVTVRREEMFQRGFR